MQKGILFIIDGIGDLPTPKTALQAAKKPNFDKLAKGAVTGLMSTISRGIPVGSDIAHLALLGYPPTQYYNGRGPLEALGVDFELEQGDVALRANFATIENDVVTDRRAGRLSTLEAQELEKILSMRIESTKFFFKASTEHRGVLVVRGPYNSSAISDTDSHHEGKLLQCRALDNTQESVSTASLLNRYLQQVSSMLANHEINKKRIKAKKNPANALLLRGAGTFQSVPPFHERFGLKASCVAGGALYKGVARYLGMKVMNVKGATGTAETSLKAKGEAVLAALEANDFVFLHVKAVDSFGHDGNFKGKIKMLERIDKELLPLLIKADASLLITGDHSTPCIRKAHSGHEVPVLLHSKEERADSVNKFDELSCMQGGLGHIQGRDVLPLLLNAMGKGKMQGS